MRFAATGRTGSGTSAPLRVELYTPCVYAEYFGWQQMNFAGAPSPVAYRGFTMNDGYQNMGSAVNWGLAFRAGPLAFNQTGMYQTTMSTKWQAVAAATGLSFIGPWSDGSTGGLVWIGPNVKLLWIPYEGYCLHPLRFISC